MNPSIRRHGASAREISFWRGLTERALLLAPTPFYLLSVEPIRDALAELRQVERAMPVPVRHWLSCKTQPVRPLLRWWRLQGHGVEVVSEFELLAALKEGFAPDRILVNGPAKHHWLPRHKLRRLGVNFDSPRESNALLPLARALDWTVGVRCQTREERNPDAPGQPTQFGMPTQELARVLPQILNAGIRLETVHFHLRTNVTSPTAYARAIGEIAAMYRATGFHPLYLDCGGGLPAHHVTSTDGRAYDRRFSLETWAQIFGPARKQFSGLRELWFENGRFLTARSGILVIRILDTKERGGLRQLICDGGRTTDALISAWETHRLFSVPRRTGRPRMTSVYGPTCMAFDRLARHPLPDNLQLGDCLVWMDAGAYHIPWETRFSHGHATVLWHENEEITLVRQRQSFEDWWGQWLPV